MRIYAAIVGHCGRLRRTLVDTGPERRGARRGNATSLGPKEGMAASERAIHRVDVIVTGRELYRTVSCIWRKLESKAHQHGVVEWPRRDCRCDRSGRLGSHHCFL